jgi:hypothetical protein
LVGVGVGVLVLVGVVVGDGLRPGVLVIVGVGVGVFVLVGVGVGVRRQSPCGMIDRNSTSSKLSSHAQRY